MSKAIREQCTFVKKLAQWAIIVAEHLYNA